MWLIFANEYEGRKHSLQTGTLYERFTQLAQENYKTEREVHFNNNQLNITSKYFNQICKQTSGSTASEWILVAARFTCYVKKLLGVTPSEYLKRLG